MLTTGKRFFYGEDKARGGGISEDPFLLVEHASRDVDMHQGQTESMDDGVFGAYVRVGWPPFQYVPGFTSRTAKV